MPPFVTPQVKLRFAVRFTNLSVPATGWGVAWGAVVPSPSWPPLLSPQQYAKLSVAIPQLWLVAATSAKNLRPPATGTGEPSDDPGVPLPSSPTSFNPQQ